jgi:hypothetical protein
MKFHEISVPNFCCLYFPKISKKAGDFKKKQVPFSRIANLATEQEKLGRITYFAVQKSTDRLQLVSVCIKEHSHNCAPRSCGHDKTIFLQLHDKSETTRSDIKLVIF